VKYTEKQIKSLIEGIYDGTYSPTNIPEDLYYAIADYLQKGMLEGFGVSIADIADIPLLQELNTNVYMFSAAKSFTEMQEMSALLTDGDRVLPYREFAELARQKYDVYNESYLQSEYNTAIAQGDAAAKWKEIESQKDIMPNLRYLTIGDACDICSPLDGLTASVDDRIWDSIAPTNHFNCFSGDTLVYTTNGWQPIKDIKVNDLVLGGSGNFCKVYAIHENMIDGEIMKATIENHTFFTTKNHRFLTFKGWVAAENIGINDIVIQCGNSVRTNKIILCINNVHTISRYLLMSIKRKWKSITNTFNSDIELRQINIDKPAINKFITDSSYSVVLKQIKNNLLAFGKSLMIHIASFWVFVVCLIAIIGGNIFNFIIKHWVKLFHSFRSINTSNSQERMRVILPIIRQKFTCSFFSFRSINPLQFNRFAFTTSFNPKIIKDSVDSTKINIPSFSQIVETKLPINIHGSDGFTYGAPLDRFNSFFDLFCHSFFHDKLNLIDLNANVQNKLQVYNLSVEKDESYVIKGATVHNCKCILIQEDENVKLTESPESIADPVIEVMRTKGQDIFVNNVGKTGEIFTKEHPYFDVASEYKDLAKQNFNLPLPNYDTD
jgi:SPP1 gp7 family putative phage head morphogenesis protein